MSEPTNPNKWAEDKAQQIVKKWAGQWTWSEHAELLGGINVALIESASNAAHEAKHGASSMCCSLREQEQKRAETAEAKFKVADDAQKAWKAIADERLGSLFKAEARLKEVERERDHLKWELACLKATKRGYAERLIAAQAEVELLTAALREIAETIGHSEDSSVSLLSMVRGLRQALEDRTAALRVCVEALEIAQRGLKDADSNGIGQGNAIPRVEAALAKAKGCS